MMAAMDEKNTIWIKQEVMDDTPDDPDSMFVEDPLEISCFPDFIKQEPEVILKVDDTASIKAALTGSESDSTRLIQHGSESCYISSEETDKQEVVPGELQIGAGESMSFTNFGTHPQQTEEEKERLCGFTLKCGLSEKEFHKFSCSLCLQNFPSKYSLIMHVFIHIQGVRPPKYVCKSCGEVFHSQISMNTHLKMIADVQALFDDHNYKIGHVYDHENILEGDLEVSSMEQTDKQFSKKEIRISKKFSNDNSNTHTMTSDAEKRDRNDKYGSSSITGNVNHRVSIPSHKCHECGKAFTQLEALKRHGLTHTESKPYKCDICGKSFRRFDNLKQHSLIHMGSKLHKCDICGKSFTRLGDVKKHSVVHSGSKPYKCNICGKSFARLASLKQHSVTHAGSKPHNCDICGKSYRRLDDFKQHLIRHTLIKITQM